MSAHDKGNVINISDKVEFKDKNSIREESKSTNENENGKENVDENEKISGSISNVSAIKSNMIRMPDRNALFCEYCVLSEMFLTAGGWRNIGMKDVTFDGNNDRKNSDLSFNCSGSGSGGGSGCSGDGSGSGSGGSGGCGSGGGSGGGCSGCSGGGCSGCSDNISGEMVGECLDVENIGREKNGKKKNEGETIFSEGKKGDTDTVKSNITVTVKTVQKVETVGKTEKEVKEERKNEIEKEKEGVEKQIEVARQHLYWMLEKKGHGRTVRFVHRGTYARHTDLLNDLKSAHTLESLQLISRICLTNVFGSNMYTNDNYDDY